jgi:hypothetical protein
MDVAWVRLFWSERCWVPGLAGLAVLRLGGDEASVPYVPGV